MDFLRKHFGSGETKDDETKEVNPSSSSVKSSYERPLDTKPLGPTDENIGILHTAAKSGEITHADMNTDPTLPRGELARGETTYVNPPAPASFSTQPGTDTLFPTRVESGPARTGDIASIDRRLQTIANDEPDPRRAGKSGELRDQFVETDPGVARTVGPSVQLRVMAGVVTETIPVSTSGRRSHSPSGTTSDVHEVRDIPVKEGKASSSSSSWGTSSGSTKAYTTSTGVKKDLLY